MAPGEAEDFSGAEPGQYRELEYEPFAQLKGLQGIVVPPLVSWRCARAASHPSG